MSSIAQKSGRTLVHYVFLILIILIALLNLAVFGQRVISAFKDGQYVTTTGIETPALYGIWKRLHHYPVYEYPNSGTFSVQLFNVGFYELYAGLLRMLGIDGVAVTLASRLITLVFGICGVLLTCTLLRRMLPGRLTLSQNSGLACLAVTLWLGTHFTSWWTLTARPDVPAAALVAAATLLYLGAVSKKSLWRLALSSVVFYAAWSMKQTCVFSFASTILCTLWLLRSARATLALVLPFAVLALATVALGTPTYRYLCFFVPRLAPLDLHYGWTVLSKVLTTSWQIFLPALGLGVFGLARLIRGRQRFSWKEPPNPAAFGPIVLTVVMFVAGVAGLVGIARVGASRNYLFECFFAGGTLWTLAIMRIVGDPLERMKPSVVLWMLILVVTAALPAAQLVLPNRFGRQAPADPQTRQRWAQLAQRCARLPQPAMILVEPFNLPWYSTRNYYPAYVVDPYAYLSLRDKGLLVETIEDQILLGKISALVTERGDEATRYCEIALAHGWRELQIPSGELPPDVRILLAP